MKRCWVISIFVCVGSAYSMMYVPLGPTNHDRCMFTTEELMYASLQKKPLTQPTICLGIYWSIAEGVRDPEYIKIRMWTGRAALVQAFMDKVFQPIMPHVQAVLRNYPATMPRFSIWGGDASHHLAQRYLQELDVQVLFAAQSYPGQKIGTTRIQPILFYSDCFTQVEPAPVKDILYSFVGQEGRDSIRTGLFVITPGSDALIVRRKTWFEWSNEQARQGQLAEYIQIMSRSRYALCPAGMFPNSPRIAEGLCAGAIPVIISDGLYLPDGVDWSTCCIRIPEKDIAHVDQIIRSIPVHREKQLREAGLKVGRMLREDPAYFVRYYFQNPHDSRCYLSEEAVAIIKRHYVHAVSIAQQDSPGARMPMMTCGKKKQCLR